MMCGPMMTSRSRSTLYLFELTCDVWPDDDVPITIDVVPVQLLTYDVWPGGDIPITINEKFKKNYINSLKASLKKNVFNFVLKTSIRLISRNWSGNTFHSFITLAQSVPDFCCCRLS